MDALEPGEFQPLADYLLHQARLCVREPVLRFQHPWLAPMPPPQATSAWVRAHPDTGDGFKAGDYSLALFHHDASEAAIELSQHAEFRPAVTGSLLCFLDTASPEGRIHRSELPFKSRDPELAKPVMAQFGLTAVESLGQEGLAWAERVDLLERLERFVRCWETQHVGLHGLFLTPSSLASGFDSDLLSAQLPDNSVEGPDTNAFMVLEYQALSKLSRMLGKEAGGNRWDEKSQALRQRMEQLLWHEDERGGFYRALKWQHGVGSLEAEVVSLRNARGEMEPLESWTTLLPLYAGIPSAARAKRLVERLLRTEGYWGPWGVRTVPKDSPFFNQAGRCMLFDYKKGARGPVSNWTGPVWILSNYYLARGLSRYGYVDSARELALKTARLLSQGLSREGALRESYDDRGDGLWPRMGTFISWNVLALTLLRTQAGVALK